MMHDEHRQWLDNRRIDPTLAENDLVRAPLTGILDH